ncbi:MAG: phenylacetate--CoA ligase family protein [Alphaproteobacteria bacterium]
MPAPVTWITGKARDARFWNAYTQTMPREKLDALHLAKLQKLTAYVYEYSPFYRRRFEEVGLKPGDIRTLEDFRRKVPITDKSDFLALQQERPPYGDTLTLPLEMVAHHVETSGSTGTPLAVPYSAYDTERVGESWTYGFWEHGIRPSDSLYFAFNWGNFAGFWSCYFGARRMGCRVISGGGVDSQGHINNILRLKPTVLISTPTFALRLAEVAREMGEDIANSSIKYTYHAGEPGPFALPAMKKAIDQAWGADSGELLGIAEIEAFAPGCALHDGVHANEMNVFSWSMDPATGEECALGEIGENIITSYTYSAQPLLNYRSHDLVRRVRDCACGCTWDKLAGVVLGRTDYMVTVRGTNVYQTAVENIIAEIDGVSPFYQLVLDRKGSNDLMTIEFEPDKAVAKSQWPALARTVGERIHQALHVRLETKAVAPEGLPRYDLKTKRIIDNRPKELRRALDR